MKARNGVTGGGIGVALGRRSLAARALMVAWLTALALPALPAPSAELVELRLPSGIVATAERHLGSPGKPAVVILHGFLQTRDFPTVRSLAEALAEDGYSVLTPNLSLDIDHRAQSLPCEALHTNSLEGEAAELWSWIDWLAATTPQPIVVIGHSSGGLQVLAQTVLRPHPRTSAIILISLAYFGPGPVNLEGPDDRRRAEADLAAGVATPQTYPLSFCPQYPTLPAAYLSYVRWDAAHSLEAIRGLKAIPVTLILGTGDQRLDWDWVARLEAGGAQVHRIEGANHFFDAAHEFELADAVAESLRALGPAP